MSTEASLDLSSASAGALADLETPITPGAPAAEPSPTPDSAVQGGSPAAPAQPTAVDPDILELKVNGRLERISLSKERDKLVEMAQKCYDYTTKTQAAAEERRQVEAYAQALVQREQQLQTFLADPVKVTQYAQYLLSQQSPQSQAQDPNAVATVAEVRQALQAEIAKVQETNQRAIAQAQFDTETARWEGDYTADLRRTVKGAIEKYPILDSVADSPEELLEMLKGDLARKGLQPTTIDEAKDAMMDLAKARATRINAKVTDHAKLDAIAKAKLRESGPEPPGGGAAGPAPAHLKLGDPRLTAAAIADMEATRRG